MEEQKIVNTNYRPNSFSFRWNEAGSENKIYYEDAEDLKKQLQELDECASDIKSLMESYSGKMKGES